MKVRAPGARGLGPKGTTGEGLRTLPDRGLKGATDQADNHPMTSTRWAQQRRQDKAVESRYSGALEQAMIDAGVTGLCELDPIDAERLRSQAREAAIGDVRP